ncbi:hypothetical protein ACQPZK_22855 [Micromonospora sp. CA-249363]|uniref:hypothetical protein n=1 Tax=Micromonospora sp. CA-249363 TaxID=3239963 RepID=UPI003D89DADA
MTVRSLAVHPSKHFRDRRELRRTPGNVTGVAPAARIVAGPRRTDRGRTGPRRMAAGGGG